MKIVSLRLEASDERFVYDPPLRERISINFTYVQNLRTN